MWSHTRIIKVIPKAVWVYISAAELLTLDCLTTVSKRSIFGIALIPKLSQNKNLHHEVNHTLHDTPEVPSKYFCQAISTLLISVKVQMLSSLVLLSQPHFYLQKTPLGSFWTAAEEKELCQNEGLLIYPNSCQRRDPKNEVSSSLTKVHNLLTSCRCSFLTQRARFIAWSFLILLSFSWAHSWNISLK